MDTLVAIKYAKEQGFFDIAKEISYRLNNLFNISIKPKPGSQMLIYGFSDNSKIPFILSLAYYLKAVRKSIHPFLLFSNNKNISEEINKRIYSLREKSIVIVNLENKMKKINGVSFRRFCKAHNIRFLVTPSLGFIKKKYLGILIKSLNVDYSIIHKKALRLKEQLINKKVIYVKTKRGTSLKVDISLKVPLLSTGIFDDYSIATNLPGGEIYFATKKNGVDGTVIIDGSIRTAEKNIIVKDPVKIVINKGKIVRIEGNYEAKELKQCLEKQYKKHKIDTIYYLGEFGIGLNPVSKIIGATIVDEKVLGTAHIAIGNNVSFGGSISAPIHWDQVFKNPEIYVDGERLII